MDKTAFFRSPLVHFFLIVAIALVCYSNTFDVPFQFDDKTLIIDNPLIKDIGYFLEPSKAETVTPTKYAMRFFNTRRVAYFTLWASYRLGGLDVTGYHVANLAIHIMNALLVYLIAALTFRTPFLNPESENGRMGESAKNDISPVRRSESTRIEFAGSPVHASFVALFSGLLFAAHPLQTEAVTYIVQRGVLLATMFYLASMVLYIEYRLKAVRSSEFGVRRRRLIYILALICAVLAMKTKENAFTLPVAIALYEFLFFPPSYPSRGARWRKWGKRAVYLVPLFLTMLIIPLEYIDMSMDKGIAAKLENAANIYPTAPPRADYLFTQFRVVAGYMKLLVFPVGQNVDHDPTVYSSFLATPVFLSFLFLLGVLGLGVFLVYRSRVTRHALRVPAFGIFWFFLALSVESSFLPISEIMVEYRVYLPSAGAHIALAAGAFLLINRIGNKAPAYASMVLVLLALSSATYARNSVWKDDFTLWKDAAEKSPNKARPYLNLGVGYESKGMLSKALKSYSTALRLKPDYAEVHHNLGRLYQQRGETDKALVHYRASVKLNPGLVRAHNNLGLVYKSMGQYDKAIEHLREALKLTPSNTTIRINLGVVYRLAGLMDKAIEHLKKALESDPDNAMVHLNLSAAYQSKGMAKKAAEHFRMANR